MNEVDNNIIFNATICVLGIIIFAIHAAIILIKKGKKKDEKRLLDFLVLTIIHFSLYLIFTLLKSSHSSNGFIIAFYTIFYIFNNLEVFLLFRYVQSYVSLSDKTNKIMFLSNISLLCLFVFLDVINIFTGIFFTAENGVYTRSSTMIISQIYQFVLFVSIFFLVVLNKKLNVREKIAFSTYCLLPLVAIILQNFFAGYVIAYASIIVGVEILFAFLNVEKTLEITQQEEKIKEAQTKIMLSQIKPHFVYNSLSSISTLIELDPKKAQSALDDFTEYLRRNLASLTEKRLIPFEDELKHIKTYISLEKMRFGNKINVIYDIQTKNFSVPPLSVQPVVENAIKHGILRKIDGGTLIIKTRKKNFSFVVEIIDDGVGFFPGNVQDDENRHFGLNNIKYRIEKICNGHILVDSEPKKGTHVTITFYK